MGKTPHPTPHTLPPRKTFSAAPKYSKRTHSVEFKKSGWKLNRDTKRITFTDGKNIGELKLIGSRDLFYFQEWQIQRIRIVKRADGYYCQLMLKLDARDITPQSESTGHCVGLYLGLKYLYADSNYFTYFTIYR